ncbi:MAG: GNAT family N-acetyltransferase [Candidatus Latescibacteria bacterium]|nr:GNAT family N-acetyltransferase [Candidatus Latescibacterota bacterium]
MKLKPPARLTALQKKQASEVLTKAFQEDQVFVKIIPDTVERTISLQYLWHAVITYCSIYGVIYTDTPIHGVACWLSPGNTEMTLWRMFRTGLPFTRALMKFSGQTRSRFLEVLDYIDMAHKTLGDMPHWYLWTLGVEPEFQHQGIGGKLIEPVLSQAYTDGIACYLETQSESNVAYYKKCGFTVLTEVEVPAGNIVIWTMLREPHT